MSLQLIRCDEVAPQPWKNGGGLTRELLAWPAQAADTALAPWTLRISVADITADGPFSAYPGIDRHFAVLQGGGVRLALHDGERELRVGDAPLAFGGEAAPGCTLLAGATRDLNLMVRRDKGRAAMRRAHAGEVFAPRASLRALFALDALRLRAGDDALELPGFTLAWSDDAAPPPWRIDASAAPAPQACWIHFAAASA